ncbi:MAG: phosphatase [Bacteroidia bacterium]|nr:phosphatase [Bacteroidia bacterium]
MYLKDTVEKFTDEGGRFLAIPEMIARDSKNIKAFVFDWDGVFSNGQKNETRSSTFNEIDSMGVNLLRFSYWQNYKRSPLIAVITGERNNTSFYWSKREHIHACYYKVAKKTDAFNHFCTTNKIKPSEVAFIFDDVIDLAVARLAGLRILIARKTLPVFNEYIIKNNLADYITANESGHYAVREACEMIITMQDNYDRVINERASYSSVYKEYIENRNTIETLFYSGENNQITISNPL